VKTVLTNCTLVDCTGAPPVSNARIVIQDNRIDAIGEGLEPALESMGRKEPLVPWYDEGQVRHIDLGGGYLVPGLWDVHCHLGDLIPDPHNYLNTESICDYTIRAGRNAIDALRAGVTGIRTCGDAGYSDVAWKRAFDQGVMVGPRLFVATKGISITGGHGHGTLGALEVDGPWEMRKAVRTNLKYGADWIKLMVTGGVMTANESMAESQFLSDEIAAATEVAHNKGKRVAVHAWGVEGIKAALRAGVDSIEHGLLDEEAAEMLVKHGAFYVPTINCTQDADFIKGMPEFQKVKAMGAAKAHMAALRYALKLGAKIACGSDTTPINEFSKRELEFLVKTGMSPMDTLIAATRTSADLCGVAGDLGTVEVGKLADLVVLKDDPLKNMSAARDVALVIKDGELIDTKTPEGLMDFFELYC
jgi:imidazolonepropionase-like amidohydrolase